MVAHYGMYWGSGRDDRDRGVNPLFAIVLMILAPFAAMLIQMAISRSREYEADASGARLCGKPLELAEALQDIEDMSRRAPMQANPAFSSLYIIKPDPMSTITKLMSTHPPTADRIARLKQMAMNERG
jgi:heat shock protein HtpX